MKKFSKTGLLLIVCSLLILLQYMIITESNPFRDEPSVRVFPEGYNPKLVALNLPPVYVVTPTYRRPEQVPELVRLAQTLMLVPKLTWLVIEDANKKSELVENILKKSKLKYYYLLAPMPEKFRRSKAKPKGVSNRNKGLEWVKNNADSGVLYFADDDNTYDVELFFEIRKTHNVSLFPVGLVTETGLSTPLVKDCKLVGFYDGWVGGRKFPVDMAGFAISVQFLLSRPNATMPYEAGFEEDGFLQSLRPFEAEEAQLLASCCTKILVWHTKTVHNSPARPLSEGSYNDTNIVILNKLIV